MLQGWNGFDLNTENMTVGHHKICKAVFSDKD